MKYQAILIDADNTLFDFCTAERTAIARVLHETGLDDPDAPQVYHAINAGCWLEFEQGRMTQSELKLRRFERLFDHYGVRGDAQYTTQCYSQALSEQSMLLPGALDAVRSIAARLPVAVVTNGIAQVQHGRMERSELKQFMSALVISEEVGCAKPDPRMIYAALERLGGVAPEHALMVGDSLTSDMRCANNAGTDACWYNPDGLPSPTDMRIDYVIRDIARLPDIALMP